MRKLLIGMLIGYLVVGMGAFCFALVHPMNSNDTAQEADQNTESEWYPTEKRPELTDSDSKEVAESAEPEEELKPDENFKEFEIEEDEEDIEKEEKKKEEETETKKEDKQEVKANEEQEAEEIDEALSEEEDETVFEQEENLVRVTEEQGNIREAGERGAKILGVVQEGDMVKLLERGKSWCKIESSGITGYVSTSFLELPPMEETEEIEE